jgi:hypothetical protein
MRCGRLFRGMTTGACEVQGVVSSDTPLPLRDGEIEEVEDCEVAISTKLRSCPMKLPFPKKELSRGGSISAGYKWIVGEDIVDVKGKRIEEWRKLTQMQASDD